MTRPTVFAVMKVTIEIAVRPSEPGETMEQLFNISGREAEAILSNHLSKEHFRVLGKPEFSHAVVKVR